MKKINALMLFALAFLISNCRTESVDYSDNNVSSLIITKPDSTGMYKMEDVPVFRNYLKNYLSIANSKSDNSELFDENQLVDVINKNERVSYSTLVKKDNNINQIWVYTVGENESFFIAEYVSSVPLQYFELAKFTGIVEYKAADGELLGTENFENGRPVKNVSNKAICGAITTPISCIEGLHFGNEPCAWAGTSSAAYYETEIIRCKNNYQNTIYNDGGAGYGSSGGATNPAYHLQAPQALNYMLAQIGMPALNSQQFTFVQNNIPIAERLRTFFFTDQTVNGSNFLYWGIDFLRQNPSTTWEQFNNWFITKSEGQDFFYDQNYWEDPNLTFQQQSLPTWNSYSSAYPNETSAQLYGVVGGAVAQAQKDYPVETQNGCALKVSRALNYSGVVIPNIPGKTLKGADNKNYFLNAKALNAWMRKTFGTSPQNPKHKNFTKLDGGNNGQNFPSLFKNKKGIFSLVSPTNSQWASGHADILYLNGTCKAGCHFFDGDILYIDFWELN